MGRSNIKILQILTRHLSGGDTALDEISGMKWLLQEGYSPGEISDACDWLKNITVNSDLCMALRDRNGELYTNRVLNATESLKIREDAYGFLVRLSELGLIDDNLKEDIIAAAMLSAQDEIALDDIKRITAMLIFEHSPGRWQSDILSALDDRWDCIYH